MRILVFNFEYPPLGGGGGVATQQLCEALSPRHTVHVVTTHFATLSRHEVLNGVYIHRVPVWGRRERETASLLSLCSFVWPAILCGWRLCRTERFDVINAQFVVPSGIAAAVLSRFFHIPLVVSFIGGDVYDPSKKTSPHRLAPVRWLIRHIAERAAARTAISHDTKERAMKLHAIQKAITVIPLGFVQRNVAAISREALGLPKDAFLFVTIGRLIPRKGIERLLRVWPQVADAHLIVVGAGPLDAALRQMVSVQQIRARVHFTGFVSEERKMQILAASDAYISSALHEGFGLVFLEAMSQGLPIIATENGGQVDFLADEVNAILVEPNNDAALLQAIRSLMMDTKRRTLMRHNNLMSVENYTLGKTSSQFEAILRSAVQEYENSH